MTLVQTLDEPLTLADALLRHGWQPEAGSGNYVKCTSRGRAVLRALVPIPHSVQFELAANWLNTVTPGRVLHENHTLRGPAKYVEWHDGQVMLRLDVPDEVQFDGGSFSPQAALCSNALVAWCQAIDTLLGNAAADEVPTLPLDLDALAASLAAAGWAASVDEGQLVVNFQRPGLFRQFVFAEEGATVRLSAELADLGGCDAASYRAATHLASAVNRRLPLARLALDTTEERQVLGAEVVLDRAQITSAWLIVATEAVAAAVTLCANETEALRDPTLAQLVVAAMAATDPNQERS